MKRKVYVFECSKHLSTYVMTELQDGSNLPTNVCNGQWKPFKAIDIAANEKGFIGALAKDILDGIDKNGYYLPKPIIKLTEKVVKA
jgi:hypothetical protein